MAGMDLSMQAVLLGQSAQQNGWFGPSLPIAPMAPQNAGWGRAFDYAQSINLTNQPKGPDGGATYAQLHGLIANCDILQIAVYTMLERISKYNGHVLDVGGDPKKPSKRAQEAQELMRFPDGSTPFTTWLQALGYDMAVTDSATVWIDRRQKIPLAHYVDGQTITIRFDETGRPGLITQIIKGNPAHNYDLNTMLWCPKNRRTNKGYGHSYVEQARTTISLALQRMARQMDYFTAGSIPDMFIESPEQWTPTMVREATDNWQAMLQGVSGRGSVQFIPGGAKPHLFERDVVKNDFDEWIARIICALVSIPATPFIREVNRATAEVSQAASIAEGHSSQLRWASDLVTRVMAQRFGPGLFWQWDTETKPDGAVIVDLVKAGKLKPSALERLGFDAAEIADEPKPEQAEEARKPDEKADDEPPAKIKNADLPDEESELLAVVEWHLGRLKEWAGDASAAEFRGEDAPELPSVPRRKILTAGNALASAAVVGGEDAATKTPKAPEAAAKWVEPSREYATNRAAEMVGMKWDGSKLIPNPSVKWQISDLARQAVRDSVSKAFEEGWTPEALAQKINEHDAFGHRRARNIARTEIAAAQDFGSLSYFKAAGVPGKKWSQYDACPVCKANAAQGAIPIDEAFQSGHQHGPAHPSCRCRVLPVESLK